MSNNIIDKIQLSGVTYDIGGQGGSGVSVVEVTQVEYDALPTSAKTDTSKMYVITDAQAGDLTNYYTKTETNTLLGGKADTATTYTKTEVDNAITAATATKQDTLVSGTNIKTINNTSILGSGNIDIQGGGGTVSSAITSGDTNAVAGGAVYEKVTKTVSTNETYNEVVTGVSRTADSTFVKTTYNDSAYYIDAEIDGLTQNLYGYWLNLKIINSNGEDWLEESIHYNGYDSTPETYNGDYYGHLQVFSKSHIRFTMNNGFRIYKIVYESSHKSASLSFNTTYNYYGTSKVFLNEYVDELVGISTYTAYTATTNTALANKVDTSTYNTYTAATDTALASKQTTLTAGTNITIVDNVISAEGGGSITIDPSLDSGSTNAVANSAVSAALNYNNMFLYRVDPVRTWDNHPTGTLQLRWRNPYNGSTATTQDNITLMKINNIPLIEDYVSGISNLNLIETSAITTSISSSSTDSQVPSAKAVNDKLGGLSIVKLTQAEYDALATKDSNTLYVIVN